MPGPNTTDAPTPSFEDRWEALREELRQIGMRSDPPRNAFVWDLMPYGQRFVFGGRANE